MQHPLPTSPGAILGYRRNGTPIRLAAGGSEAAPEPQAPPAAPPAPPADPAASTPPAAPAVPEPPAQQSPAGNADELPGWAQRELKRVRDEAATHRVKAKEATDAATAQVAALRAEQEAQRIALGRAFGFVGDEPPTAEQLAEQLTAAQSAVAAERDRARAAAVELAVFRAAATLGADGNALLDSRQFTNAVTGLDPAAETFAQQVSAAITAATEAHPQYKLAPAAPIADPPRQPPAVPQSSPGQFTGSPSAPRQLTVEDAKHMTPLQVQQAINEGLFVAEGFGPSRSARR